MDSTMSPPTRFEDFRIVARPKGAKTKTGADKKAALREAAEVSPRSALEVDDATEARLAKIIRIVGECRLSLADLPMMVHRACKTALAPPTGPVFLSLPGDILKRAAFPFLDRPAIQPRQSVPRPRQPT